MAMQSAVRTMPSLRANDATQGAPLNSQQESGVLLGESSSSTVNETGFAYSFLSSTGSMMDTSEITRLTGKTGNLR
jgi:hypothetical protein